MLGKKKLLFWAYTGACRGWPWSRVAVLVGASPVMSKVIMYWKGIWQYLQVLPAKNNSSWQLHFFLSPFLFLSCHSSFPLALLLQCSSHPCHSVLWNSLLLGLCSLPAQHSQGFADLENLCVLNSLFHCYGQVAKDVKRSVYSGRVHWIIVWLPNSARESDCFYACKN